jgi:hypothetical protein
MTENNSKGMFERATQRWHIGALYVVRRMVAVGCALPNWWRC